MTTSFLRLTVYVLFPFPIICSAQELLPYKNKKLPIETRVQDLLQRMTPEEKFMQLFMVPGDLDNNPDKYKNGIFGLQVNTISSNNNAAGQMMEYSPGRNTMETAEKINSIQKYFVDKTRLGIPIIAFDEALHGLVRKGATAFPQSIALAATWDTLLMSKVANAIATECSKRGIRQILSPVINLATDARWGRVEETYGEDPFLSSAMGIAFIKAFEQLGIVTTPKHFAVNHGEGGRDSYPIDYNERLLEETYLVPFKAAIQQGGARSIMTAYNSLNGRPCTANDWLLNNKLKKEWSFKGFVISDAGAVGGANVLHFTASGYEDAGKQSIESGLDVMFQTDIEHAQLFKNPFLQGKVNAAKFDSAVARVLRVKFELGLFENPYTIIGNAKDTSYLTEHRQLSKYAALKSFVLLKNDKRNGLPISEKTKRIAIIGTDATEARLGGYSGPGNNKISLLEAMKKASDKTTSISFAEGCGRTYNAWNVVDSKYLFTRNNNSTSPGLKGEYFNNTSLAGKPVVVRNDAAIDFQWTLFSPEPLLNYDFFSCRWTGFIMSPATGKFKIGINGNDGYRLFINQKLLIDTWGKQSFNLISADFYFEKGRAYSIKIEYKEPSGNSKFRLIWNADVQDESEKKINEAVQLALKNDVTIIAAGINEGEFQDRSKLNLPGKQEEMIVKLASTGKPIVVLLFGGSAITMNNWIDKVNAVLDVWYPGEAGAEAIVDVLYGRANPSGKLPITFPLNEGQLPLNYNHKPTGRGDDYNDGSGQPLFPFGYGLSYTEFEYGNAVLSKKIIAVDESTTIKFTIRNTGNVDGDEVVQLYLKDELASVARPVKELKAIQRISLKAGEEKEVVFEITPAMLSLLNDRMERVVEPGTFRIMIGSSSKDIRVREIIQVEN